MRTTVLLITVVSTVILMVTFKGQRDAGTWGHAAKLVGRVTSRSGWRRTPGKKELCFYSNSWLFLSWRQQRCWVLTTLLFVTHVPTVVVAVTLPDAADAAAIGAAILVWQTAVLWSRRNMQTCKLLIVGGFVSVHLTTRRLSAVRAYSHPSWCRCCCGAGSLGDTDTAALRWASWESGRRLGKRRCACGRAEADTAGCTAGRHKRYGLTRARTQFISFKPEEDWQHHHLPAWSSPLFFPL